VATQIIPAERLNMLKIIDSFDEYHAIPVCHPIPSTG